MRTLIVSALITSLLVSTTALAADKGLRSDAALKGDAALGSDVKADAKDSNGLQDAIDRDRKAIEAATAKMQADRKARAGREVLKADRDAVQDAKNQLKLDQTACTQAYAKALAAASSTKGAPAPVPCK